MHFRDPYNVLNPNVDFILIDKWIYLEYNINGVQDTDESFLQPEAGPFNTGL